MWIPSSRAERSCIRDLGGRLQFDEVVRKRRSVRKFTNFAPSGTDIQRILEVANMAPSAGGLKARNIMVVRKGSRTERLAEAAGGQQFVGEAPFVMVFCADITRIEAYGDRGVNLYCIQDTAAAVQNALLKASDLGIGSCWVGAFDPEMVTEIMGLPGHLVPQALVPLGYEE